MERKLEAERRTGTGKGVAHKIRAAGRVPAVVYGHGAESVALSVDARELFHTLHTDAGMNVLVDLKVDGETLLTMPREIQQDHLRGVFLHVDFLRIARDQKIAVEVPIQITGESAGVKAGGVVEHHLWNLHLEAFPQDVPASLEADITKLGIGDSLKVSDLKISDKLTVLTDADETVVSVVEPQVLRLEEEVEAVEGVEAEPGAEGATGQEAEQAGAEGGGESGGSGSQG
jgi:large subunit ribosomal protein L25